MGKIVNVVLSGGVGSRLWPISRFDNPKQFLKIFEGKSKSLFQFTMLRNENLVDDYMLVTNQSQLVMASEQAAELGITIDKQIVEPVGRNTAPAIALAALALDPEDVMFITPSDHMIGDEVEYKLAFKNALRLAKEDNIVTFGIQPLKPETGYGYIEYDSEDVSSFREKPNQDLAIKYIRSGNFCWNSGMFCFKASVFLQELKKYQPEMYEASVVAYENSEDGYIKKGDMEKIPEDSIDFAVLEKSKIIKMVKSHFIWSDLGSFDSLIAYAKDFGDYDIFEMVKGENVVNSYAMCSKPVFATRGIDHVVLIETNDCILLITKDKSEEVKQIREYAGKVNKNLL
ncbi:mannose-1-phosphate guanylyltransferase [Wenyingzhuangia sp. 2_MG-2023]|uniref:mannose-1-phosphate guanylyltransferase n=1 Tax=Wenyingzhuangia sp. 2_MG-2023 TaxID=3062639 RepID=UPI0026E19CCB|nr:sugar phosphate nucleotidyltransferase [Wenyingzhuangia sp. 2_MG-2023]MDO6739300.1 sugar phosphate nucleotidyltransferase [Wenyingzhuangia sp. 2_MG-2023]